MRVHGGAAAVMVLSEELQSDMTQLERWAVLLSSEADVCHDLRRLQHSLMLGVR